MVGATWGNKDTPVFTDAFGNPLMKSTVYREFKKVATAIGRPDIRFLNPLHTFAVVSLRSGDDIKTIQGNPSRATVSSTLGVYGHVTMQMKRASAARMEEYIRTVSAV